MDATKGNHGKIERNAEEVTISNSQENDALLNIHSKNDEKNIETDSGNIPDAQGSQEESEVDGRPPKRIRDKKDDEKLKPSWKSSADGGSAINYAVDDDRYPVNSKPYCGYLLLINNVEFQPESTMHKSPRSGSDRDAEQMESMFKEIGFEVDSKRNLTVMEMRRAFFHAMDKDFSNLSVFACCILSHGGNGFVYGTDGTIAVKEISNYFLSNKLAGKPKLFFFQACQGDRLMESVKAEDGTDAEMDEVDGRPTEIDISLPTEADVLYAYSTVPGFYAWRDTENGSWFIQALCEVFRRHAHKMDLVRMLTRVNNIVARKKSNVPKNKFAHGKRQIPSIVSQLRMDFFFNCAPLKAYPISVYRV